MIYVLKTYIYYILYNLKKKIANTSLFLQKKIASDFVQQGSRSWFRL